MTPLSRLLVDAGVASRARVRAYEEALERPLRPSWEDAPLYFAPHEEDACRGDRWCKCGRHSGTKRAAYMRAYRARTGAR